MKLITGMHRAGTSLVARLFCEAGADLGDAGTFYRPDRWNPDGYFEQPEIQGVNMKLIHGVFWKFAYFRPPSTETIRRRAERVSAELRRLAHKYAGKVVKEPRFCLTLPAWQQHGTRFESILVCLRDPASVARSVQRRNRISIERAEGLWLLHYERLLENARDLPVRYVHYGALLDPVRQRGEIAGAFHFMGMNRSDSAIDGLAKAIVKRQLDHSGPEAPASTPAAAALWNELVRRWSAQATEQRAASRMSA